jgi:hypothetical protein
VAYSGGTFYIIIVPDTYSLKQYIIILIFLFKILERLKLTFILLFFILYFCYSILFDSIIYNRRLYNKKATGVNPQLKKTTNFSLRSLNFTLKKGS